MQGKPKLSFKNNVIFVSDVKVSKHFYKYTLGQEILDDFNRYVGFKGGFGIWQGAYASELIHGEADKRGRFGSGNGELYFETEDLDGMMRYLKEEEVPLIHEMIEHDWGQRGFRIHDPDGHIIEISEPMEAVVRRLASDGISEESIAQKTMLGENVVNEILGSKT